MPAPKKFVGPRPTHLFQGWGREAGLPAGLEVGLLWRQTRSMESRYRLAELSTRDALRLHQVTERLRAIYEAIAATNIQAKPAIHRLIQEAGDEVEALFSRCAWGLALRQQRGCLPRLPADQGFIDHVTQALQEIAESARRRTAETGPTLEAAAVEQTDGSGQVVSGDGPSNLT